MSTAYNIAFFGTPHFTVELLDALAANGYVPTLIVTAPNRPSGRGMKLQSPEPKVWGDQHNVTVLQPEKLDDTFFTTLSQTPWDLFIVVAYGKILPEQVINLPRFGTINVHYSLLPHYRGATPVESAILNGDTATGVTLQQMTYELDSGDILSVKKIPIASDDTTPTLRAKLNAKALALLPKTVGQILSGTATATPQTGSPTRCSKIKKEDGFVSLSDDPLTLDRKFRAYQPWPGIFFDTARHGKPLRVKLTKAHLTNGVFVIDEVIPENHKRLSWERFQQFLDSTGTL
ncbi:MAG TPA: methionyl-tRNA formyltransferase [Candidatus Paceibacterota bacterium]|nr:methionyl-tRNA formyltransferase [Candidatus Paceibacterota bacterium]